jgi:low-density lipoprotein receptor-related protein 1 (alpha-2-macroglobulin receptor)
LLCDNIDNCGDNSDEKDCDLTSLDSHEFIYDDHDEYDDIKFILEFDNKACKSPELYCGKDRKCISMHQLCDGKWDCSDGSDEGGKCGERICDVFSDCQFFCHNIPTESGVVCYCPEHLTLDSDGKSCISPDICEEFSCSHICETLSPKKTRCRCSFGYQLKEDNFTCESMDRKDPILMFSSRQSLKGFKLNKKHQETRNFYQKGVNIVGFDFYFDQETKDYTIFWSDIKTNEISSGVIVNEEIQHLKTIVKSHLSHVESVAIDWIGKNLYWLDSILKHIDVTTKDGMHRATLISEDISKPRSLAIDSRFAYLFWSDWDGENPRIERATLAGEDRKSIFNISSKAGGWANGITLDFVKKRIFYVDAKTKEIHTINYDGENFKRITRDTEFLPHPYAITAFENNLYWTDWRLSGVGRCDKFTGNNIEIFLNASHQLFDIKLIHSSRQPIDFNGEGKSKSISSPCDKARCSHLCLLSTSTTFKCGCPRMMRLKANSNETCENINRMVFYISENAGEIRAFDFDYPNSSSLLTIYDELKIFQPTILDTHPTDMRVFWFDKQVREINSMKLATSIAPSSESIENIFDTDVDEISSFAIDWSSNLMFFSVRRSVQNEPKTFELRCSNTKGEYLTVILDNLNIINNLTVSTRRRKIYFVTIDATDDSKYLIKESNYDGSDYITIYYEDEIIESLVMDDEKNKLYFVKNHRKIFSFNLESKEAKLINTFYGEINEDLDFYIKSISLFENDLYFYENTTNSLRRCNKLVCHEPSIFRKSLKNIRQFLINQFNFISKDDNFSNKNQICYKSNRAEEEDKRVCEHLCMPKGENVSNFVCKCAMGYKTDEKLNMKCIPAVDSIIYIHDHEIRSVNMLRSSENEVKFPPLQHINSISYFDIDISRDLIYIADNERGEIYQTKRDGSLRKVILKPPEGFEMTQYDMFSGLAIDWIAQNLYFSDKSKGIIEFVSLIGHYRYVLLSQINKPSQINIDPMNGIIFFIDGNNKIMKHYLNESSGGNSAVIPVTGRGINIINVINDYVLDIDNQIIYACEAKSSTLWRIDYDGVSHKEIKNTLISNWISIDVMDGRIFWAERDKDEVKSMKVNDFGSSFSSLNVDTINVNSHIQKLKIMSSKRQFGSNACAIRNGNCLEICLSENKEGNVICLCAKGKLNDDKRTCKNYGNYLFFSSEKQFEKQGLDHIPEHPKIENSTYLQHAVAMTYDFERQLIFYSDFKLNAIFSCNFNGNDFKLLIDQQASVEGITWNSQNNELFWTMYKDAEIRSKRLSNSSNTVITILKMSSDVDKLRAIAVEPCLSLLYFSNWNKKNPTISRIFVTGYGKENVITSNIVMPNALALDLEEKLLFWADAKLDKLERCNYDGRNRVVLSQSSPKHPFALTVFKQFIYWSDWTHRAIVRINKFSGNDPNFVATNIPRPLGLFVAQSSMKNCTNAICSGILSGCEDVCLPKGNSFECHCTQGILDLDGRRCVSRKVENSCDKSQEYQCKSGECVPFTLTCDTIPHCSDSSDESRIFCATRKCPFENFYQCHDSRCISKTEVCDGKSDCKSGEDEEKCKEMGCKSDEFKCRDGNCIKKTFVCDYKPDCLDASDEIDCKNRTCKRTLLKTTDGIDVNKLIPCYRTSNCYLKEWECDGKFYIFNSLHNRFCNNIFILFIKFLFPSSCIQVKMTVGTGAMREIVKNKLRQMVHVLLVNSAVKTTDAY